MPGHPDKRDVTGLYSFRVTFHGDLSDPEQVMDILYGAACDDATVSVERDGSAGYADFEREATDALSAIVSAVEQIEKAGLLAASVGEDLVTVADIAERTGRSQHTVSAWITGVRGPGGFPASRIDRHWGRGLLLSGGDRVARPAPADWPRPGRGPRRHRVCRRQRAA